MLIKYFYDEALAQASYMVGCQASGDAIVVDPMRDIVQYLDAARKNRLRVAYVTETHIHADFVSGARELTAATGAKLLLSDEGGPDWRYGFAAASGATLLRDGDRFTIGRIRFEVLATPGHTPEHIVFLVTDNAAADAPIGIFTGDCVFVGDVGRPDLLETAAGVAGSKEAGARQQFASIARLGQLADYLQIWPGHGAGSACGKALGAIPSTTLGYERRFNPAFQMADEASFVRWLLAGQPEPPRYFGRMKVVNRDGPALVADLPAPRRLDRPALDALLADGAQVLDLRPQSAFARHHIAGTLSIPATRANFSTYVGWVADYDRPFHLIIPEIIPEIVPEIVPEIIPEIVPEIIPEIVPEIVPKVVAGNVLENGPEIVPEPASLQRILASLRAIGVDDVRGWAGADVLRDDDPALPTIDVPQLAAMLRSGSASIVDVRGLAEWQVGHLPGAVHIPLGEITSRMAEVPRAQPTIIQCQTGYRAHVAVSVLRRAGVANVLSLVDPRSEFATLCAAPAAPATPDEGGVASAMANGR